MGKVVKAAAIAALVIAGGIYLTGPNMALLRGFFGKALLAFGISKASQSLFKPKTPDAGLQDRSVTTRNSIATRKIIYGRVRTGGTIVYIDTTDDNRYLHIVVAYATHEIDSYEKHYFDDHALTLSGNDVTEPAHLAGKVKVYEHFGEDSQAADAALVGASLKWTNAHVLRGIAYTYYRLEYSEEAFISGVPNITAVILGKPVYDYRNGATQWSNNPVLCIADYITSTRYGIGADVESLDLPTLITNAYICGEPVLKADGSTEARYTCNGVIDTAETPRANLEFLATSLAAPIACIMGKWYIYAAAYRVPVIELVDSDLAGAPKVVTRQPRAALFNAVKGTYVNPDNDWQPSDYPPVQSINYAAEDNNETIWRELDLPLTSSASMAQRVATLSLTAARRQISVSARFNLKALDLVPGDTVMLTLAPYGFSSKVFEVQDWGLSFDDALGLGVDLLLRETDSAVYDWTTADESAANAAPTTNLPNYRVIQAPTGLSASSMQIPTGSGFDETYKVLLQWTQPNDYFVLNGGLIEVQYKLSSDADWLPSWYVPGAETKSEIGMLIVGQAYDFRIRSFNYIARSAWVSVFGVTVLSSGTIGTSVDWGDFITPFTTAEDWGLFRDAPTTAEDWGSFA